MGGDKRKISSGSEISFSELKQLAEDGDAIAQNKPRFCSIIVPQKWKILITSTDYIRRSEVNREREQGAGTYTVDCCP